MEPCNKYICIGIQNEHIAMYTPALQYGASVQSVAVARATAACALQAAVAKLQVCGGGGGEGEAQGGQRGVPPGRDVCGVRERRWAVQGACVEGEGGASSRVCVTLFAARFTLACAVFIFPSTAPRWCCRPRPPHPAPGRATAPSRRGPGKHLWCTGPPQGSTPPPPPCS